MGFLKAYYNLVQKNPMPVRMGRKSEETDYTDYVYRSRNVYFSFDGGNLLDSAYLNDCSSCTDCFSLSSCRNCELCYECIDCFGCYASSYLDDCQNLTDCHFCSNCRNCTDLFGCFGLKFKKYCIFNQQYSKKEYQKRLRELKKVPIEEHLKRLEDLKRRFPARGTNQVRSENCDYGDYVLNSANCYWAFDTVECQDSAYLTDAEFSQDCFDGLNLHECELCYESHNLGHSYACSFINNGDHLYDCHFCTCCYRSKYLFGCVNLYQTKYCILNKQYKKDEYFAKIRQIKKELGWKPVE